MGFPKWMRRKMFARSNKTCEHCGRKWIDGFMLEFHHKIPLSNGGKSEPCNAELLCRPCHLQAHMKLFRRAKAQKKKSRMNANAYAVRKIAERIKKKGLYRYGKEPS